jgi:hypothetical protein
MGEVYRGRATRLNRDVALKVLPDAFTLDPERLARFLSLTQPNLRSADAVNQFCQPAQLCRVVAKKGHGLPAVSDSQGQIRLCESEVRPPLSPILGIRE